MLTELKKKMYSVKTFGCDVLGKNAEKITVFDDKLAELAADMVEIMNYFDGIGLAAPQIGISKRLVVLGVPNNPEDMNKSIGEVMLLDKMPLALVNPEITAYGSDLCDYDEGCLSVPGIYGSVQRPYTVKLKAQDLQGNYFEYECGGLLGRCIQHELDHLDGKLFVDRMSDEDREKIEFKLFRLKKNGKRKEYNRPWK
jgi:peptide deformylase